MIVWAVLWGSLLSAPPDVPERVGSAARAAVRVRDAGSESVGTGVMIGVRDATLYVLTAAHIFPPDARPEVDTFADAGERSKVEGTHKGGQLVFRNVEADVAVIRLPAGKREWPTARPAALAADARVKSAWVIGCEDGREPKATAVTLTGRKLVRRPGVGDAFYWEADGESVPGRSGGPLFDPAGRLIGICSGTQGGKSYFAHSEEIRAALRARGLSWALDGTPGR